MDLFFKLLLERKMLNQKIKRGLKVGKITKFGFGFETFKNKKSLFINYPMRQSFGDRFRLRAVSVSGGEVESNQPFKGKSKSSIIVYNSPTGSGKTFGMIQNAILNAERGRIVVLAFPNLNLVNENLENLETEIHKKKPNSDIKVLVITLMENLEKDTYFRELVGGRVIVVTLHSYFNQRGEYWSFSNLFYILHILRKNTVIFFDEAQIPLKTIQRNIPLSKFAKIDKGVLNLIKSGRILEETVILSLNNSFNNRVIQYPLEPSANPIYAEGKIVGYTLTEMVLNQRPEGYNKPGLGMIDKNDLELFKGETKGDGNLVDEIPLEPSTSTGSIVEVEDSQDIMPEIVETGFDFAVDQNYKKSNLQLSSKETPGSIPQIFPVLKDSAVKIEKDPKGNPIFQEYPFYTLAPIKTSLDPRLEKERKEAFLNHQGSVISYNAIVTYCRANCKTEWIALKTSIREISKDCPKDDGPFRSVLIDFITKRIFELETLFEKELNSKNSNLPPKEFNKRVEIFKKICSIDFSNFLTIILEVLSLEEGTQEIQNLKPFELLSPNSEEQALSALLLLSQQLYIVYHYPKYRKETPDGPDLGYEKNYQIYREKLDNYNKKKQERIDKGSKEPLNSPFIYSSDLPFTYELVSFSLNDIFILKSFLQINYLSATHSDVYISEMKNSMPEVNFLSFDSKRDPLDKLVLVESSIDLFGSTNPEYKKGWNDWSLDYYNKFIKGLDANMQKFSLFLLGSNNKASKWVKRCTKQPNNLFTLVEGSKESDYLLLVGTKGFQTNQAGIIERNTTRVSSIFSTLSVGLNMPSHSFLVISAANYYPMSVLFQYGDLSPSDAKTYINVLAEVQAIGRMARRSTQEEESNSYTARVVVLSQAKKFTANSKILAVKSKGLYKRIEIVNLDYFDSLLSKKFQKKDCLLNFKNNYELLTNDQKLVINPHKLPISEAKEGFRFELLKKLSLYLKAEYNIQPYLENNIKFFLQFSKNSFTLNLTLILANFISDYLKLLYSQEALMDTRPEFLIKYFEKEMITKRQFSRENNLYPSKEKDKKEDESIEDLEQKNSVIENLLKIFDYHREKLKTLFVSNSTETLFDPTKFEVLDEDIRLKYCFQMIFKTHFEDSFRSEDPLILIEKKPQDESTNL